MTVIQKTIGRLPVNLGDYNSTRAYGKKNRVLLYGCEWESKVNNNTYAPAALNTTTGVITPDTTHWKLISGSYNTWLIDNGYQKMDATNVKDGNNNQHQINASFANEIGSDSTPESIKGRIKSLENNVGSGGSVDQRIAAAKNEVIGGATSNGNTLKKVEDRVAPLEMAVGTGGSIDERIAAEGALHYLKSETYNKTEVNGLVSTPHQEYVTVSTYASLPASGSEDTIYRVSNYDGTQVAAGVYSEYAWDGTQYVFLAAKSSVDEVFDITVYNSNTKYADLAAALGVDGANIPQNLRKGGMSVKFVQSSDNKYVQYRCVANEFTIDTTKWAIYSESVYVENPEFIEVKTDREDKILQGIKSDGTSYIGGDLQVEGDIKTPSVDMESVDNPEWIEVKMDEEGKIIEGIKHNGEKFISNIDSPLLSKYILELFSESKEYTDEKVAEVSQYVNPWKNKKAVWLGTSIPANGYPQLVGQILEATVTNESQGSSMCRMGRVTKGDAFGDDIGCTGVAWQSMVLSLSLSQEEKLRIFKRWTTENRKALMISEDGYTAEQVANVVGYGNMMAGSFVGEDTHPSGLPSAKPIDFMYEGYVNARKTCYSCSWNNSVNIESGFGTINGKVEKYFNTESFPDIWVFDHGHNDSLDVDRDSTDTIPSDPLNRSYFIGSMNFIISKILGYNSHAVIVLIGHYTDDAAGTNEPVKVISGQEKLADYWQFPLMRAWEVLPFSPSTKITTTGYYDSNGTWHDTGYDGSPSYQHSAGYDEITDTNKSSAFMGSNHYGMHYSGGNNNVRQINGVWVHDLTMKQIWMQDDLHPNYLSNPLYAKRLANWLKATILI